VTDLVRTPGKRGKLPAKPSGLRFIHDYAIGPVGAPEYPVDVSGGISPDAWGMDGNGPDPTCTVAPDGVGNCTFCGRQHLRQAKAAAYGERETWETSNELVEEYLAYDGGQDNGAVISDLLLSWYRSGKIFAYAPVDHSSPEAIDAAMQAFGGVYVGVNLTDDADQLFSEGLSWTIADGQQPDPSDGHCIVGVKATASGRTYVTWGAEQEATAAWSAACVTEVYVILTTEDQAAKVDMSALTADIEALHGTGHVDTPAAPARTEPPVIPGTDHGLLGRLEGWIATHFAPELARARADAARALEFARAHAAQDEAVASLLAKIVSAADPAVAPVLVALVPEAERVLAEAERLVAEFAGPKM
jgi:hypothetical protein